jgi:uncharacterized protein YbdZ (MbtH family)
VWFGFALTDPGRRLSRTRLFPEVSRIVRGSRLACDSGGRQGAQSYPQHQSWTLLTPLGLDRTHANRAYPQDSTHTSKYQDQIIFK